MGVLAVAGVGFLHTFEPEIAHELRRGSLLVGLESYAAAVPTSENAPEGFTRPPDASVHVSTETLGGDTETGAAGLPLVTPGLFLEASLIVAERACRALAGPSVVEEFVRQGVRQMAALRAMSVNHG